MEPLSTETPAVPKNVGGARTVSGTGTVLVTPLGLVATNCSVPEPEGTLTVPLTTGMETDAPLNCTTVATTEAAAPLHTSCAVGTVTGTGPLPPLVPPCPTPEPGTLLNAGAVSSFTVTVSVATAWPPFVSTAWIVAVC